MPVAFVVLAHKQPEQVRRLVTRLQPNPVFVHVDARVGPDVFEPIRRLEDEGYIRLLPRFRSGWASWGLVEATLAGFRAAGSTDSSHVVSITAQCYPLWPVSAIGDLFAAHPDTSWIHQARIPVSKPRIGDADGGSGRITKWHLTVRGRHLRVPVRRQLPAGLIGHYGQMQCCLSAELARWVVDQLDRRPEVGRYFRRTQAPDELLIPTLAMSSPMADQVSDDNLWYMNWKAGGAHPKTLTTSDFDDLARHAREGGDMCGPSPVKCFARKFDAGQSADLLDRIDAELLQTTTAR
jgi:hypothetical protein